MAFAWKRDLPAGVAAAFGELAERGEPFQQTDVIVAGQRMPLSRFVSAQGQGCTLSLSYEHGGIAYGRMTARFQFVDGAWALMARS